MRAYDTPQYYWNGEQHGRPPIKRKWIVQQHLIGNSLGLLSVIVQNIKTCTYSTYTPLVG